jgi:hypothetical protein
MTETWLTSLSKVRDNFNGYILSVSCMTAGNSTVIVKIIVDLALINARTHTPLIFLLGV